MAGLPIQELLDSGAARVGLFFAVSVVVATLLGAALGDVREGVETGISVGFLMAAFALLFVRSADDGGRDGEGRDGEGRDGEGRDSEGRDSEE